MCKWCADEAVPSHKRDATAPASRKAQCPVCRRTVKNKVRETTSSQMEVQWLNINRLRYMVASPKVHLRQKGKVQKKLRLLHYDPPPKTNSRYQLALHACATNDSRYEYKHQQAPKSKLNDSDTELVAFYRLQPSFGPCSGLEGCRIKECYHMVLHLLMTILTSLGLRFEIVYLDR
jgi:hypothetical protein